MKYYLANLGVHLLVTVILILILVITTNRNKRGECKRGIWYFLPLVISAVTVFYLLSYTAPRLLDLSYIIDSNYYSYTGKIEEISQFGNSVVIDGTTYYINPLRELPAPGTSVRIRYSRYSHYAIDVAPYEELNVPDTINEELQTTVVNTN